MPNSGGQKTCKGLKKNTLLTKIFFIYLCNIGTLFYHACFSMNKNIVIGLCLLWLCSSVLHGQDSLSILKLNEQAQNALKSGNYPEALRNGQQSVLINQSQFAELELQAHNILAAAYRETGDLPKALKSYLQLLQIDQKKRDETEITRINFEIGTLYQTWNVQDKALQYFQVVSQRPKLSSAQSIELAKRMAYAYDKLGNYPKALEYYQKLLEQAEKEKDKVHILTALRNIIEIYKETNDFGKAYSYSQRIIQECRQLNDPKELALSLNNMGYLCRQLDKPQEALQYFKETFDLEQKLNISNTEETITLTNIGILYQNLKDYKNSVAFLNQALKLAKVKNEPKTVASLENLLATVYLAMQEYEEAEKLNAQAIKTANGDPEVLSVAYFTACQIQRLGGDYKQALSFYEKSVAMRDTLSMQEEQKRKADLLKNSAVDQTEKEIRLSLIDKEIKQLEFEKNKLQMIKKEQELVVQNQKQSLAISQLQQKELERVKQLQDLALEQQKQDAELKAKEIEGLQRDKKIQDLELKEKTAQEQQRQQEIKLLETQKQSLQKENLFRESMEKEQEKQKQYAYAVIGLISVVLVIIIFSLQHNKKQRRLLATQNDQIQLANAELAQKQEEIMSQAEILRTANEEIRAKNDFLEIQKTVIEKKNEDITASITYAQRIQQAMLPSTELILDHLPDSFILFKPRDIVSGDFYWYHQVDWLGEPFQVLAAIDCTGHGVPGAFMSMIGHELLNEILRQIPSIEPQIMLNELHKGVKRALKQKETSNRDGMDMTLALINRSAGKIELASAKNPFFIIQKGEIQQIKGDKMPIGGNTWGEEDEKMGFTKQTILLTEEDGKPIPTWLYMFTDGFQDQFGGTDGRKFMIKRFRELVFAHYEKIMMVQHALLDEAIETWMKEGGEHQIDDILVIGVKV